MSEDYKVLKSMKIGQGDDAVEAHIIDDSKIGEAAWSGLNSIERLCPPFTESGTAIRCEPIEGYPLKVTTKIPATQAEVSQLTLIQCGKNLYDHTTYPFHETRAIQWGTGYASESTGYNGLKDYMPIGHLKGATITLNHPPAEKYNQTGIGLAFYDATKKYISGGNGYTHTVPDNAEYMNFSVPREWYDGSTGTAKDIQIELGSVVTEFEPYRSLVPYVVESPELIDGSYEWNGIKAINGVNSICVGVGTTTVEGKSDPVVIIEKLTQAFSSLGSNV